MLAINKGRCDMWILIDANEKMDVISGRVKGLDRAATTEKVKSEVKCSPHAECIHISAP